MRKFVATLLFLLSFINSNFSQANSGAVIHLTKLPLEGILLDKGWKFQTGDNQEWAKPEYNDNHWQTINPTLDIHDLLPQIPRSGIVWFRLRLSIDSTLNDHLVLLIQQSGGSELYLNDKLIYTFGVVDANPDKVKAFSPLDKPVSFPLRNATNATLAIRYALQRHILYGTHWGIENPALRIVVNTTENGYEQYRNKYTEDTEQSYFRVGVLLILGILYLTFFLFHHKKKVNLYFSLYALFMAAVWSYFIYAENYLYEVALWYPLNNIMLAWQVFAYLLMLSGIYHLFQQKRGWIYYFLFLLGFISIPCSAYIYGWGWLIFGILFTNLINFDIIRIAFTAVRNNKKGAWIIAIGGIGFLVFWFLFSLQFTLVASPIQRFLNDLQIDFFSVAQFSIPVAVSIYLGYDFALTNRALQQKLTEVENLSVEKQQILTSQNEILEGQVNQRTSELRNSLKELKETQAQLVQSEKMASLGELTAGIAHEIQNPLNFVNNFSEVNTELIEELKSQKAKVKSERDDRLENELINDIAENEQKINHHGKRADSIVKGMLQHSRSSSGKKEPTDINALADEYLRLSYHGFRAKDKSFNATIETHFDESIGKIEVIPQDIGRVLLNLFNNAFYAVTEKKISGEGYEPTISVSTKKEADKVIISVKDNGIGIPKKAVDKIFQPFFTTKPTGQGTGLGLSLSYDIVKANGGEIKVETKEGEGTEFIIQLPIHNQQIS